MLYFRLQRLAKSVFLASKQRLLDGAYGNRWPSGKPRSKLFHLGFQLRTRHHTIDESQLERRLRVDYIASVKHFGGLRRADKLRQKISAAVIGKQSDFYKSLSKNRFFGRDSNVGCQRDIHSGTSRRAVDRGNHRLRNHSHAQHRAHSHTQDRFQLLAVPRLSAFADRGKIAAGAESSPCSRQYHHAHSIVLANFFKRLVQRGRQLVIQRVQLVWAVHHQKGHPILDGFEQHRGCGSGNRRIAHEILRNDLDGFRIPGSLNFSNQRGKLPEVHDTVLRFQRVLRIGSRQHVDFRAIE